MKPETIEEAVLAVIGERCDGVRGGHFESQDPVGFAAAVAARLAPGDPPPETDGSPSELAKSYAAQMLSEHPWMATEYVKRPEVGEHTFMAGELASWFQTVIDETLELDQAQTVQPPNGR